MYHLFRYGSVYEWLAAGFLLGGFLIAVITPTQDYLFLPAAYTDGQFVRITGTHPGFTATREPHTVYLEQYRYMVGGHAYYTIQNDNEETQVGPQYTKTVHIAYKTADPNKARIIYAQTLQADAKSSIESGTVIALGGMGVVYIFYLFSRLKNRIRKPRV